MLTKTLMHAFTTAPMMVFRSCHHSGFVELVSKSSSVFLVATKRSMGGNIPTSWSRVVPLDGTELNVGAGREEMYSSSFGRNKGAAPRESTVTAGIGVCGPNLRIVGRLLSSDMNDALWVGVCTEATNAWGGYVCLSFSSNDCVSLSKKVVDSRTRLRMSDDRVTGLVSTNRVNSSATSALYKVLESCVDLLSKFVNSWEGCRGRPSSSVEGILGAWRLCLTKRADTCGGLREPLEPALSISETIVYVVTVPITAWTWRLEMRGRPEQHRSNKAETIKSPVEFTKDSVNIATRLWAWALEQ